MSKNAPLPEAHLPRRYTALGALYGAAWAVAEPLLHRNARLADGFAQRLVPDGWAGPCDVWIQAASAGEAYLAAQLLPHLAAHAFSHTTRERVPLRILLTSMTRQGITVLVEAATRANAVYADALSVAVRFFPFDKPSGMRRALAMTRPRALVLLETEIWPGLLLEAARAHVPVLLLNGRMSAKSLKGYRKLSGLWRHIAPARVAAISEADAARFAALFGEERIRVVPNIKFDRVSFPDGEAAAGVEAVLPVAPRVLLASTREEEETQLLELIRTMRDIAPDTAQVLAPRHMHRLPAWQKLLEQAGIPYVLRTSLTAPAERSQLILWDAMGELVHLYAACQAVFVGGSLVPLGGQNFLEPLATGLTPFVGPHLKNFAWAESGTLEEEGLLNIVKNSAQLQAGLYGELCRFHADPAAFLRQRQETARRFAVWVERRTGGGARCAEMVRDFLA